MSSFFLSNNDNFQNDKTPAEDPLCHRHEVSQVLIFHFFQIADAIVFSVNNWLWNKGLWEELPAKRFPWQHYIAYTYEPAMAEHFR